MKTCISSRPSSTYHTSRYATRLSRFLSRLTLLVCHASLLGLAATSLLGLAAMEQGSVYPFQSFTQHSTTFSGRSTAKPLKSWTRQRARPLRHVGHSDLHLLLFWYLSNKYNPYILTFEYRFITVDFKIGLDDLDTKFEVNPGNLILGSKWWFCLGNLGWVGAEDPPTLRKSSYGDLQV
jgi:hypothetical protein